MICKLDYVKQSVYMYIQRYITNLNVGFSFDSIAITAPKLLNMYNELYLTEISHIFKQNI